MRLVVKSRNRESSEELPVSTVQLVIAGVMWSPITSGQDPSQTDFFRSACAGPQHQKWGQGHSAWDFQGSEYILSPPLDSALNLIWLYPQLSLYGYRGSRPPVAMAVLSPTRKKKRSSPTRSICRRARCRSCWANLHTQLTDGPAGRWEVPGASPDAWAHWESSIQPRVPGRWLPTGMPRSFPDSESPGTMESHCDQGQCHDPLRKYSWGAPVAVWLSTVALTSGSGWAVSGQVPFPALKAK